MCMTKMPGTATNVTSAATLASSSSGGMATGGPSSSSSVNRRNASQSDETDSASDEVKVFNDEDEREPAPSSSESRNLDFLTNIKSSLISETEQVRENLYILKSFLLIRKIQIIVISVNVRISNKFTWCKN